MGERRNRLLALRQPGSIDSHAGRPLATLFDNVSGGTIRSSGGLRDYPQHLRDLVIWNFRNTSDKFESYDFWKRGVSNRFVKPVIVGFHGNSAEFNLATVGVMESYGAPVEPASLYEAQLGAAARKTSGLGRGGKANRPCHERDETARSAQLPSHRNV